MEHKPTARQRREKELKDIAHRAMVDFPYNNQSWQELFVIAYVKGAELYHGAMMEERQEAEAWEAEANKACTDKWMELQKRTEKYVATEIENKRLRLFRDEATDLMKGFSGRDGYDKVNMFLARWEDV